uniref:Core shell protein Gag P30 domain-containing protein n=1 Tax=Chrysemys picta bellii TaxID=8478 RepID=A0A8C3F855_CHRPI
MYLPGPWNPSPVVMAEPVSPSAPTPPPYKDKVPQVPEIAPLVGFYPLITETRIAHPEANNRPATTMQVYMHVPFNPVDLAAFKAQVGEFSTNPSKFISVFEGCLASHKPDWDDCNVLMRTLLSEMERNQVVSKAREEAQRRHEENAAHVPVATDQFPIADPRWNPNDPAGQTRLTSYKQLLLHGLRHLAFTQDEISLTLPPENGTHSFRFPLELVA